MPPAEHGPTHGAGPAPVAPDARPAEGLPGADQGAAASAAETATADQRLELERLQRQVEALAQERQRLLASFSWRVTAPLRRLRTWLGAPPPVDPDLPPGDPEADLARAPIVWGACVPPVPEAIVVAGPDQARRSNDTCALVRPEALMDGVFPEAFLGRGFAAPGPTRYHGTASAPARIAFVGSAELAAELAFDAEVVGLDHAAWPDQLRQGRFAFVLVEPVLDGGVDGWAATCGNEARGRPVMEALVRACREQGVPLVLWYRAPVADLEHIGWMAPVADRVYAVDQALADALGTLGAPGVAVLAPAIQPALHNPFRRWAQLSGPDWSDRVLYDGWLDLAEGAGADPLLRQFKGDRLLVAESRWDFGGVRLADQADFLDSVLGCLTPAGRIALSKMVGAEAFRPSPLVPDWLRQTMMMRAVACGSLVATSAAMAASWGRLPLSGEGAGDALLALLADPVARARVQHEAMRGIVREHCLADRLDAIAADLGLGLRFGPRREKVACLLVTMRPDLLPAAIERFRADRYPDRELVVVLHGHDAPLAEARALVRDGEPVSVHRLGRQYGLGTCLNFAASRTDAHYWAKVDDDDLYGPDYLSDLMLWRRFRDFQVGGKTAAFTYAEDSGEIRLDDQLARTRSWQHRRAGQGERIHVAGGTLVGTRDVLRDVPFSDVRRKGSDTDFLRRADAAGYDFHGFDIFNFALFRSGREGFHTWNVDRAELKQRTRAVGGLDDLQDVVFI